MALHPFQSFRRNQKTMMAGLVIMCMFIFILQFGKGDVLDRMMTYFGAGRSRTTDVATVYGSKITDLDLDKLRRQRELANSIVFVMTRIARETLLNEMQQPRGLDEFDEMPRISLQQILRQMGQRIQNDQNGELYRQFMPAQYLSPDQRKAQVLRDHDQLQLMEQSMLEKGQTEQARKVRQFAAALEYEMWARDERTRSEPLYFGGSLKVNDLLDFAMWKKQADKLGISLTQADIRADINREAFNFLPLEEDQSALVSHVQRMQRTPDQQLTSDSIYEALGDELRVYLAQCAVLGYPPGLRYYRYVNLDVNHVPATATPDEFWSFYQDNRTTLRVELLPIKAEDFLAKVGQPPKDEATQQALQDLFNRYKEIEPNPELDVPGFKEPRRVGIEWISARQDSPHPRKQADTFILSALAAAPAGNAWPGLALTTQILEEYDRFKNFNYKMPGLMDNSFSLAFYRNATKPADAAAALGQALGAMGTGGSPASVATLFMAGVDARNRAAVAAAVQSETQRRAGVVATLVLSGQHPWTKAGLLRHAEQADQSLPLDVVKKEVMDKVRDEMARRFLIDDLKTVQTELAKLKVRPEEERKKEADKYLAKAIKDFGLAHGTTEKPRDAFDIEEDKGLKSIRESYRIHPPREDIRGRNFAALFFDAAPPYMPEQWPSARSQFDFFGARMWESADEPFLYWKTEDKKAYTPATYAESEKKVIEAWRYQKARELARQEAERIQQELAKVRGQGGDGLKLLREESAKHPAWGDIFAMSGIARLVPVFTGGAVLHQYGPYQPDEDRIKARGDFVDQLMRSLKERGDATVVWNRPETIYYVTLLTDIGRPDENKFYSDYANPHVLGDNLWRYMEVQRRQRYYQATMEQLRTEAGAPKGKWNVPDDVRKRVEGRESSSEE